MSASIRTQTVPLFCDAGRRSVSATVELWLAVASPTLGRCIYESGARPSQPWALRRGPEGPSLSRESREEGLKLTVGDVTIWIARELLTAFRTSSERTIEPASRFSIGTRYPSSPPDVRPRRLQLSRHFVGSATDRDRVPTHLGDDVLNQRRMVMLRALGPPREVGIQADRASSPRGGWEAESTATSRCRRRVCLR